MTRSSTALEELKETAKLPRKGFIAPRSKFLFHGNRRSVPDL
jgi:hypothetical protein